MTTTCTAEGCDRTDHTARGMCGAHYQRWRRARAPRTSRPGNDQVRAAKARAAKARALLEAGAEPATVHKAVGVTRDTLLAWCRNHDPELRMMLRATPAPSHCTTEGCELPVQARGLCNGHYCAARKNGMGLLFAASDLPDMPQAACKGLPDGWFPDDLAEARIAASACARCPHLDPCRDLADGEAAGVWGGIWVTTNNRHDLIPPKPQEQEVAA